MNKLVCGLFLAFFGFMGTQSQLAGHDQIIVATMLAVGIILSLLGMYSISREETSNAVAVKAKN